MKMKLTQQQQRKRRLLLALPALFIPFLTLGFYAMGGGGEKPTITETVKQGLNAKLPDANLKEESLADKLSFYDKADKDSIKKAEWMRSDPYYTAPPTSGLESVTSSSASKFNQRLNLSPYEGGGRQPEDEVVQKLALLQKQINQNTQVQRPPAESYASPYMSSPLSSDVERLETMMERMSGSDNEEDPAITQLSGVMDKILDIQHPDRVKDRLQQRYRETASPVNIVSSRPDDDTITSGFFGMAATSPEEPTGNGIKAVVNEHQVLVDGAIIKLRLLQDAYTSGQKIPQGSFIYGTCTLEGERLSIAIHSVRCAASLYHVKMQVYDMDGLPGIHIPGAIGRDVAKQSADNSMQLLQLASMDPSLKAQAATAGINGVKSFFGKKVKLVKVTVKAGYKVLLVDESGK